MVHRVTVELEERPPSAPRVNSILTACSLESPDLCRECLEPSILGIPLPNSSGIPVFIADQKNQVSTFWQENVSKFLWIVLHLGWASSLMTTKQAPRLHYSKGWTQTPLEHGRGWEPWLLRLRVLWSATGCWCAGALPAWGTYTSTLLSKTNNPMCFSCLCVYKPGQEDLPS